MGVCVCVGVGECVGGSCVVFVGVCVCGGVSVGLCICVCGWGGETLDVWARVGISEGVCGLSMRGWLVGV